MFAFVNIVCIFGIRNNNKMKTSKNHNQYVNQLSVIIPRNNGTQAGVNALAESLKRGLAK